ncbi:PQQ-dependent sugar dehydrogenase [Faecalibacter sp. WQ 117]|uniref:PQQ-dependent sugar dehydrogenase n=2 Tax=Faecalibacter rhinopitheci TaxID=2779678 RepID=A0A8J7FPZ9_9FLAO|nr:PQQ-dependent sugar dehydrogenase [Faecalibacter rhinopitheci]MBQ0146928.1 PQQ-dependent sugar dehydrogenase [Candidatus Onthonaster equi]
MKNIATLTLSVAFLFSCTNNSKSTTEKDSTINDSIAKETEAANTEYKPAFDGQTRANYIKTKSAYEVLVVNESLGLPWAIVNLPDGKLLMTEKSGYMMIVDLQKPYEIKKVTGLPKVNQYNQGGLLDVILDPNFDSNRTIYWTFSEPATDGSKNDQTSIAKGKLSLDETKVENVQIIYRTFPSHDSGLHYGSRLVFDKEGYLYASFGERSDDEMRKYAQDLKSPLGKIIKITTDGKAAPGNPFMDNKDALPEIYSLGHRSPQSLAFNDKGELWEVEHGPRGGDELNLIQPGKNYGWPTITYGIEYAGGKISDGATKHQGLEQPNYYWDPVIAPSGAEFYTGSIEEWKGNLFVGGMIKQALVRLVIEGNKVVGEEHILLDQKDRIRDMVTGKDGHLYAVGDNGKLYRIAKK